MHRNIRNNGCWLATLALVTPSLLFGQEIKETFVATGVTQRMGGYRPLRAEMSEDAKGIEKSPEGLAAPKYGRIEIEGKSWAFILDEPEDGSATLYIDTNNDGDLTNDPQVNWKPRAQGQFQTYNGEGKVELNKDQTGAIGLYR